MGVQPRILVLDAMGVLYQSGYDVEELLIPFVRRHNPTVSVNEINEAYLHASLGKIASAEFWNRLNLSPDLEDEYLSLHQLTKGTHEFLSAAVNHFETICCLSNDVSEWSLKLRNKFVLTNYISYWVISSDVGFRKPSPEIYLKLLNQLENAPSEVLFVDDRFKNLDAASSLGIGTILFDPEHIQVNANHRRIEHLTELLNTSL